MLSVRGHPGVTRGRQVCSVKYVMDVIPFKRNSEKWAIRTHFLPDIFSRGLRLSPWPCISDVKLSDTVTSSGCQCWLSWALTLRHPAEAHLWPSDVSLTPDPDLAHCCTARWWMIAVTVRRNSRNKINVHIPLACSQKMNNSSCSGFGWNLRPLSLSRVRPPRRWCNSNTMLCNILISQYYNSGLTPLTRLSSNEPWHASQNWLLGPTTN